jgi:hypothetical protein
MYSHKHTLNELLKLQQQLIQVRNMVPSEHVELMFHNDMGDIIQSIDPQIKTYQLLCQQDKTGIENLKEMFGLSN